ncbi:MAG: 4Fe-4S binding protein [Bacteroidales bacterium]|nr:4Fe-4S binding protein [Bacteroidales bacterium]
MEKNIFIFDQNKCVGCHACVIACMNENGFQSTGLWRNIYKSDNLHLPTLPLFYLSLACNHCDDAPCLKNCPSLAYSRDEVTSAVIHHPEKCIGCKYCTWACPYDAPKYNPKEGIIEKCTFCNPRIEEELKPACAHLCPVGALDFINTEFSREESAESSPVDVNVGSKIKIKTIRKESGPEIDLKLFEDQPIESTKEKQYKKISARDEWPLIIFTLLSATLVSLYASGITEPFNSIHKHTYIGFGAFATILSMLHLGKKNRFWRSLLNFKNSWLSREILFFALFLTGVFCEFYLFDLPNLFVSAISLLLLFSIDMLYYIATWKWSLKIHSAQTVLSGLTLFAVFTGWNYLFVFIMSFRLTIYIYRKFTINHKNHFVSVFRITLALAATILLFINQNFLFIIGLIAIAEIIDRIEFYNELKVSDPEEEIQNKPSNKQRNYATT